MPVRLAEICTRQPYMMTSLSGHQRPQVISEVLEHAISKDINGAGTSSILFWLQDSCRHIGLSYGSRAKYDAPPGSTGTGFEVGILPGPATSLRMPHLIRSSCFRSSCHVCKRAT